jgi:hypothetical protein
MTRNPIVWGIALGSLLTAAGEKAAAQAAPTVNPVLAPTAPVTFDSNGPPVTFDSSAPSSAERNLFESDRAFPGFIGPITNPVLTKDPRSLTEARGLFINNQIDPANPFGPGDFQVAAMQVRVALTDRLTFVADKDGYAWIHPNGGAHTDGWLDINAGLKYTLIRDEEHQFLVTIGGTWEPQTGAAKVFQNNGSGVFTIFGVVGKEFGGCNHVLVNAGYQFPADTTFNSSFFYAQLHLDRQMFGWLYPLVELNWFHYTGSGDHGLPPSVGELDGLINLGTSGVAGNDLVTAAAGLKFRLGDHAETGFAFEVPISSRHDFLNNRLTAELILRY